MAEGRYSTLLEKMKKAYIGTGSGMDKLKAGWKWENGQYVKIWSGATVVSYYDDDTLMGTEEVDEGEDVLRPSFSTSKENYTMVGWSTTNDESGYVDELTAQGDTMTLYAIYVPNSITVVSGSVVLDGYTLYSRNSKYVSGTCGNHDARAGYYVGPGTISSGFNIDVQMGFYQNGTLNFALLNSAPFDVSASYMGSPTGLGSHSASISASGNYYGSSRGSVDWQTSGGTTGGVTSLVLTNPKAWE